MTHAAAVCVPPDENSLLRDERSTILLQLDLKGIDMVRYILLAIATVAVGAFGCSSDGNGGSSVNSTSATGGTGKTMICAPGVTQTCVGPGACRGGQACSADGMSWAACNCGSETGGASSFIGSGGSVAAGGTPTSGGSVATGGAIAAGGATMTSGTISAGGTVTGGGMTANGGVVTAGGTTASGGASASGGTVTTGGTIATGGVVTAGGTTASSGTVTAAGTIATGGVVTTGGTTASGGLSASGGTVTAAGTIATGGVVTTGGTTASGGLSASGGTVTTGGTTTTGTSSAGGAAPTGGSVATGGSACTPGTQIGATSSDNYFVMAYPQLSPFYLFNNGWSTTNGSLTSPGTQESISAYETCAPGTIAWKTDFDWSGASNMVKGFPCAILGWQQGKGWMGNQTWLPKTISSISSAKCSWTYGVTGNAAQDVAFDIWIHGTPCSQTAIGTNAGASDEVMIWLYSYGGVLPAGSLSRPGLSISGATWNLWESNVGAYRVHSYVRTSNSTSVTDLDILAFLNDANLTSKCLSGIQAGTEIFQGSGSVNTSSYTCEVQ
jgi:xyloglucan-specific endo-beta-1,4-glucanase